MKRGIIVINAFDASPAYLYQSARLKEEFDLLEADVTICKNDDFGLSTDENGIRLPFNDVNFAIWLRGLKTNSTYIISYLLPLITGRFAERSTT